MTDQISFSIRPFWIYRFRPLDSIHPPRKEDGATLIELMIALFLLSTALLGLTALSHRALRSGEEVMRHDLATLQANNLAARILSNPVAAHEGLYRFHGGEVVGPDCSRQRCNPEMLARFDLQEWNQLNRQWLPQGSGRVQQEDGGRVHIQIFWQQGERRMEHSLVILP